MSYSMAQLLAHMRKGPVTLGWGAVAAYSRSRLNDLLEQQYLARLEDNSYLPPFTQALVSDTVGDGVELQGLRFGAPLLSFDNASLNGSQATLRLNIVSGLVVTTGRLIGSTQLTEDQGLWVALEVDLETVTGEVSPYGRVTLNLAHGSRLTSNLFEHDASLGERLAGVLEQWMHGLPARQAVFELGTVDFSGYDALAPTRFIIRTQAAPGAKVRGALNHGDGAVLVFIELRAQKQAGSLPDERFPYLIPDGDFSATLVLHKDFLAHASEQGLELLARLLFPQLNAFVKKEDHTPLDRALFGSIDPTLSHFTLEPALGSVVAAGGSLQFTLRNGAGQQVQATAWHAVSPQSHTPAGHGSISASGLYRAPHAAEMGREVVTVIVTAEHAKAPDVIYRAAARLHVVAEALLVTPSAAAYRPEQQVQGLDVWNAGGGATAFKLLEPYQGELATLGPNHARFVPEPSARRRLLAVQQVQASVGEQRDAALIMVNGQPLVHIDPPFLPSLPHGGTAQLNDVNHIMPNHSRRWRVMAGQGSVSSTGHFQASAEKQMLSNVVACEVVHNGVVFAAGYSVLKETDLATVSDWKSLQLFTLTVGKNLDGTRGIVGSSGYQQLEVEITVETQAVDGNDYKLSVDEIASLALFDRAGQKIATLSDIEEGIAVGEGNVWRTSRVKNRFVLANESDPIAGAAPMPRGPEDRTIRQVFYLHRRGPSGSQVFYAGFQKDTGEWFYSNDTSHRNATIEVQVRTPEPFKVTDYSFTRKRVAGGGGDLGGSDPEHTDFDLHPVTDDYWLLDYRGGTFYTAEFVKARESDSDSDVNTSIVRWESAYGNEIYHSYTGYLFQNHGEAEPEEVQFDIGMSEVLGRTDYVKPVASQYEAGLLVIANFRNRNRALGDARATPEFAKLSKPLRIRLRDSKGNDHLIQIDYLAPDTIGDRNVLVHSVPSRPAGQHTIIHLANPNEGEEK